MGILTKPYLSLLAALHAAHAWGNRKMTYDNFHFLAKITEYNIIILILGFI